MRRAIVAIAATGIVGALGGCGSEQLPAVPTVGPGVGAAGATTSAGPSAAATTTPALLTEGPIAPATVFTGDGDQNLTITKPAGATTVIATIDGNAAGRGFRVKALDGESRNLLFTQQPYHGSMLLDADGGSTTQLQVRAKGPWSITLSDVRTAPAFVGSYNGTGDSVVVYRGTGGGTALVNSAGTGPFQVRLYTGSSRGNPVVDGTGPLTNAVRWPGGTFVVEVTAPGAWSIAVG